MNAQDRMIEYAKSRMYKMEKSSDYQLTPEQWLGKMIDKSIVIERIGETVIFAKAHREGKNITITETTRTETHEVIDGKVVFGEKEETIEVMQITL